MRELFGDGIRDDTPAIQELLDSGAATVELPAPAAHYLISRTLVIHSDQALILKPGTVIRLAPHSDCLMLANAPGECKNITVIGGIWDFNNMNQRANPLYTKTIDVDWGGSSYSDEYLGVVMRFQHIAGFTLRDITLKDPVTFGMQMAFVSYFTIENIRFDYNYGNPYAINMDGVHLDGGCSYGVIRDLKGTCYDDLIALNANDFYDGPIGNIEIDGVFCENCHSAVRLLSTRSEVGNITISNVHGTFYQYCVGLTRFYDNRGERGVYGRITLRDIFASKAERLSVYRKDGGYVYSLIWVENKLDIKSLTVDGLYRREETTAIPLVGICENSKIERLSLSGVSQENRTGSPIPVIKNNGYIDRLYLRNVDCGGDELLAGDGGVGTAYMSEL